VILCIQSKQAVFDTPPKVTVNNEAHQIWSVAKEMLASGKSVFYPVLKREQPELDLAFFLKRGPLT
jgi:hypothetical protein